MNTIEYLKDLISYKSITPKSAGCIEYLGKLLQSHGFEVDIQIFGSSKSEQVTNLYAFYGKSRPNICFVGHIDVVPPGDNTLWYNSPFEAYLDDNSLYGRGAVDMKGAIACFIAASLDFIKNNPSPTGSISFLITSDEEGSGIYGTQEMLKYIYAYGKKIDFAIIGEPTCEQEIGDIIKIGRRGSVNFTLTIEGCTGHIAYPHKAQNPIPCLVTIMNKLINTKFDQGSKFFPKTNLEFSSIYVDNKSVNVIPQKVTTFFNIRFNELHTSKSLTDKIEFVVKEHCHQYRMNYKLESTSTSESFIQEPTGKIIEFANIVKKVLGIQPEFSNGGGISDARYIKNYCPFVEFGLLSATAHKVNECTKLLDLEKLYKVYYASLVTFLT